MALRRQAVIALLFGLATDAQRSFAQTRTELGARFLERICTRLEERAEAAWSALGGEKQPETEGDAKAA